MKRLPWLLLLGALLLPGLALAPKSQHVFWVPESAVWMVLAPAAALMAWWSTRQDRSVPVPPSLRRVFWALALGWALSAAFALRVDESALSLLQWLGYPLVFFATWRLAGTPRRRALAVALLLAYGWISVVYAVAQAAGWDRIPWATGFGGRSGAFFGNPNFLGGHLALLFPLSLALALDQRGPASQPRQRWGAWATVAVLGLGLLLAQTRGAWLGALAGSALVLALAGRHLGGLLARNRRALGLMAGLGLLGWGLFFYTHPAGLQRVRATFTGEDRELPRRLFLMGRATRLAGLHPWLGVGPGNIRLEFARVQAQGLAPAELASQPYVVSEHAHNDLLQMAAEAGIPAALLWAALMLMLLWLLHQSLAAPGVARGPQQGRLLALGVLGGLVGLGVHGLGNFPFLILPTQGAAWALAAIALRANHRPALGLMAEGLIDEPVRGPSMTLPVTPGLQPALARALLGSGLLLLALDGAYQLRRLQEDRLWWVGQGEAQLGHPATAEVWLQKALSLDPKEDRLWGLLGQAQMDQGHAPAGVASLREGQRLSPYDPEVSLRLGRALIQAQDYAAAVQVLQAAAAMAPNFADLQEGLGAALYLKGEPAAAAQTFDRLIQAGLGTESAYEDKAAAQGAQGQLAEALATLQAAEQRYPDKPKVYVNEAITYFKLGRKPEARVALKKAEALGSDEPAVGALRRALR